MMKINIYYGGRGLIEDATIYVMNKLTEVLEELRVEVTKYNLYEEKNNINMLPQTLKEVDGVILATSVEWFGIGGFMQQFLDACWLYGDKEKIRSLYMLPVVTANTCGERDAQYTLIKAWEMLGGLPIEGICAYVNDNVEFETNPDYALAIEKKAEMMYRTVNKKEKVFPNSMTEVQQNVMKNSGIDLTPQESEQLSKYVSDDTYVKKQKEDIQELTQLFKEMMGEGTVSQDGFVNEFKQHFKPINNFEATYAIEMSDDKKTLVLEINNEQLKCYYGEKDDAEVYVRTTHDIVDQVVRGTLSFKKAFISGKITAKGNFKTLEMFDSIFQFKN